MDRCSSSGSQLCSVGRARRSNIDFTDPVTWRAGSHRDPCSRLDSDVLSQGDWARSSSSSSYRRSSRSRSQRGSGSGSPPPPPQPLLLHSSVRRQGGGVGGVHRTAEAAASPPTAAKLQQAAGGGRAVERSSTLRSVLSNRSRVDSAPSPDRVGQRGSSSAFYRSVSSGRSSVRSASRSTAGQRAERESHWVPPTGRRGSAQLGHQAPVSRQRHGSAVQSRVTPRSGSATSRTSRQGSRQGSPKSAAAVRQGGGVVVSRPSRHAGYVEGGGGCMSSSPSSAPTPLQPPQPVPRSEGGAVNRGGVVGGGGGGGGRVVRRSFSDTASLWQAASADPQAQAAAAFMASLPRPCLSEARQGKSRVDRPCLYFAKGTCVLGADCRFLHAGGPGTAGAAGAAGIFASDPLSKLLDFDTTSFSSSLASR